MLDGPISQGSTSEMLMVRYQRGERQAFSALVTRHLPEVYNLALRWLGDPTAARRAARATFHAVTSQAAAFKHETGFRTWLMSLAVAACRLQEGERITRPSIPDTEEAGPTPGGLPGARTLRAISELPLPLRSVYLLKEVGGLRLDDIARLLAIDEVTVRHRLRQALEQLETAVSDLEAYLRALR